MQTLRGTADSDTEPARDTAAARVPGDLIDLTDWYLTLPTGKQGDPDTVENPEPATFTNEFFTLDDTGEAVVFSARGDGVTTKNSHYPRSELREMTGNEKASWSNTSGTHTLDVCEAITKVPAGKPEVVAAQIHDGGDDVLQIRLEGPKLMVQYDDGKSEQIIDPDYTLGTPYHVRIVATDSKVDVLYNGEKAELPLTARAGTSRSGPTSRPTVRAATPTASGRSRSTRQRRSRPVRGERHPDAAATERPGNDERPATQEPATRTEPVTRRPVARTTGTRTRRTATQVTPTRGTPTSRTPTCRTPTMGRPPEWRVQQSRDRRREARRRHQRLLTTESPTAAHRACDRQP